MRVQVDIHRAAAWIVDGDVLRSDGLGIVSNALVDDLRSMGSSALSSLTAHILASHPNFGGCGLESECSPWEATTLNLARWLKENFRPWDDAS